MATTSPLALFAERLDLDARVALDASGSPVLEEDEELTPPSYSGVDLMLGDSEDSIGTGVVYVTTR